MIYIYSGLVIIGLCLDKLLYFKNVMFMYYLVNKYLYDFFFEV